ncbi:MAG: DUF4105 domain-containing protein [Bacteroidales bacterium]
MYRTIKLISVLVVFLSFGLTEAKAQFSSDSLRISLLTASPGQQVYERFGHTALRVKDLKGNTDLIFNYGLFSFNTPNFIYRFVKGETDYQLGVTEMRYFLGEYAMRGSRVTEQILDLSPAQSRKVFDALMTNYQPENRIYRYNFFYDNCSTRPRDIVEQNIGEAVRYFDPKGETTYRELVHEKTAMDPWLVFGIDLTLGEKADRAIDYRQEMFLPEILMEAFDTAKLTGENGQRPLVKETVVLVEEEPEELRTTPLNRFTSPLFVCWSLFVLVLLLTVREYKKGKVCRIADTLLFGAAGIAGCILFFLNFISTHPTVDNNFNCIWLQPLHLFAAVAVWVKSLKRVLYYYHFANFATLILLLAFYGLIPQQFNAAFFPLIGVLILRSGIHIILRLKKSN